MKTSESQIKLIREDSKNIKKQLLRKSFIPVDTGRLKSSIHSVSTSTRSQIVFDCSESGAPYIRYLNDGTGPHDIPNSFGYGEDYGIGGRFDGKFHPGSTKHKNFINEKSVNFIIDYLCKKYNGRVIKR